MSRKIFSAALALTVAGGVYFAGEPAQASNMGFKLERSFDLLRDGTGRPYLNLYLVSFPKFNGLADVANNGPGSPSNKCVGDPGGPAAGDGVINPDDAICDMWTSREGSFNFLKFNRDTCAYEARTGSRHPTFGIQFTNGYVSALESDIGYEVQISSSSPTVNPQNRAVIVGSHDPSWTGRPIISAPGCDPRAARLDIINLVYHTMYTHSDEVLCGLEGTDWVDTAPPLGVPDTCPNGTLAGNEGIPFDGSSPLQIQTYDNDTAHGYVARTVSVHPIFGLQFAGPRFPLRPGDAYILAINTGQDPTTFLSPHF